MIQISAQYGDPKADRVFWPLQKSLNDKFSEFLTHKYFKSIEKLSIIFRVSGKVRDFKSQGPEIPKFIKKELELTIDLVFSEPQWKALENNVVKATVIDGVKDCVKLLVDKSEQLGELIDRETLMNDIEKALVDFKKKN